MSRMQVGILGATGRADAHVRSRRPRRHHCARFGKRIVSRIEVGILGATGRASAADAHVGPTIRNSENNL